MKTQFSIIQFICGDGGYRTIYNKLSLTLIKYGLK